MRVPIIRYYSPSSIAAATATAILLIPWNNITHGYSSNNNNNNSQRRAGSNTYTKQQQRLFSVAHQEEEESLSSSSSSDNAIDSSFASEYHSPVMHRECITALINCSPRTTTTTNEEESNKQHPKIFVDGTLGGGGHSLGLLEKLNAGDILFGCDIDPDALATASKRLERYQNHDGSTAPLFVPVSSNFCDLVSALEKIPHPYHPESSSSVLGGGIDGILLDLGVSSYQINTPERGFAFAQDGPLDMRMSAQTETGLTAADLCNLWSEFQLKKLLKQYGDEPRSKMIARSIIEHRPLTTTQDLVAAVAAVVPQFSRQGRRKGRTATLARVFQALRIVVNREDEVLQQVLLEVCPKLVRPGGRLVVLSYHSMEDRLAKRVMRDGTIDPRAAFTQQRDVYGNIIGPPKPWKPLGKRRKATEEEVAINSRARSATLRIAERNTNEEEEELKKN